MPPKKPTKAALFATLIQACENGDLAKATQAVDGGADVNKKSPDDLTPLFIAVENKHKPIVEYLLSKGARIDEKNGVYRQPALNKAYYDGSFDIASVLVDAGADVNLKSKSGYTPLFIAVQRKHKPSVEHILSKGARIDEKNGPHEISVLYKACMDGSFDIAELLVDAGADVNLKSTDGFNPLYIAVENNHKPIVEYLLSKGALVNEKNTSTEFTALYKACFDGSLDMAKVLVNAGADVNMKTKGGYTPLFIAVEQKHKPIVEYLLSKGARINEKNGSLGQTALNKACLDGALDIVTTLVDAGADVNIKSTVGYTPLYAAVQENHKPVVEYLLSKGARVNEKSGPHDFTAIYIACYYGSLDIVSALVDAGADVNLKSKEGYTPLFVAVQSNHKHIVEYVLSKGAHVNEKCGLNEQTPLYTACYFGSLDIVKILIQAGADINLKTEGKTPLDIAIEYNYQPIIEYLESLQPISPPWTGFTQSDISKFDTIFETEAPPGQLPPAVNYACCPVCLKFVERSEACMYMSHKCTGYYHKELHKKYANDEGKIYWCTICGRVCLGHRHYSQTAWNAEKPGLLPSGDPFENDCKKTNGGGGVEEKLARFRALRNTAYELQAAMDAGETFTIKQAMDELVQQCWSALPGLATKRIMTKKAWNRPLSNFRPNAPPNNVKPQADYPKNDPGAYEAPRILVPGNANFGPNHITYNDSEPVIEFKHKKADGSMYVHPFVTKETLLTFLSSSGPDWPCFDPTCGGHLWPAEVIQALENPALAATAEEKAKAQAYKERVHGPPQAVGGGRRKRKTQRRRR